MALIELGASEAEAYSRIWMVDSRGLIVKDRPAGGVTGQKIPFAQTHEPIDKLEDVIKQIKPTAIIGRFVSSFRLLKANYVPLGGNLFRNIRITLVHLEIRGYRSI